MIGAAHGRAAAVLVLAILAGGPGAVAGELPGCVAAPPGLVGWWRGEGNGFDYGGANPIPTPLPTDFLPGEVRNAFHFGSNAQGLSIPHADELNPQATGFSVEFWMKGSAEQPDPLFLVVDKSHGFADSTGWVFQGDRNSGKLVFALGAGGPTAGNFPGVDSLRSVLDGAFHHVAGTWDGEKIRLFVDGIAQGETPLRQPANNSRPVSIGYSWGGGTPTRFFRGAVDELAVYNRALDDAEISRIFGAGGNGKCVASHALADVALEAVATPENAVVGETFSYSFRLRNNGPEVATEVVATYRLPEGLDFVSFEADAAQGDFSNGVLRAKVAELPAGKSAGFVVNVRPSQSGVAVGFISAFPRETDPSLLDNTFTFQTLIAGQQNLRPDVKITRPAEHAAFPAASDVTVEVAASDPDGNVARVELFANAEKLGESAASPFTFSWTPNGPGTYTLTAKATDNRGASRISEPVSVLIVGAGAPALLLPSAQPGPDFVFSLSTEPGSSYEIQATEDLVNWMPLTYFFATDTVYEFTDFDSFFYDSRFYRATRLP